VRFLLRLLRTFACGISPYMLLAACFFTHSLYPGYFLPHKHSILLILYRKNFILLVVNVLHVLLVQYGWTFGVRVLFCGSLPAVTCVTLQLLPHRFGITARSAFHSVRWAGGGLLLAAFSTPLAFCRAGVPPACYCLYYACSACWRLRLANGQVRHWCVRHVRICGRSAVVLCHMQKLRAEGADAGRVIRLFCSCITKHVGVTRRRRTGAMGVGAADVWRMPASDLLWLWAAHDASAVAVAARRWQTCFLLMGGACRLACLTHVLLHIPCWSGCCAVTTMR